MQENFFFVLKKIFFQNKIFFFGCFVCNVLKYSDLGERLMLMFLNILKKIRLLYI